eukprot:SAG31_NODE_848_length_11534_cov_8.897463_11_plen_504_part_00
MLLPSVVLLLLEQPAFGFDSADGAAVTIATRSLLSLDEPPPPRTCRGGVVFADCFGWNATDGTAALQAALDSRAHTVWVRNVSGLPWTIQPVFLRSNTTVRFAAGSLVVARRGAFHAKNDSLINIGCATVGATCPTVTNVSLVGGLGATLRMWREDYANPKLYSKAEWRHGVSVAGGSQHVRIEGLRIELTGGDGICLGDGSAPSVDTLIRHVHCDRNYRQGLSVVNVRDLVVEDSRFTRTVGTDPQSGCDIEPSHNSFFESNLTFRRCGFFENLGTAFKVNAGVMLNYSAPFTLLVEDCNMTGGSSGSGGITLSYSGAKGSLVFRGGTVGPTAGPGLLIEDHTAGSAVAVFDRLRLLGTNYGPYVRSMAGWPENCSAPVCIHCSAPHCLETIPGDYGAITDPTPGGLVFADLKVDPACGDGEVGHGSYHCLPAHGGGHEPFAVVSTGRSGSTSASVATGTVIVSAANSNGSSDSSAGAVRACSVSSDTPAPFRDVAVDCHLT